MLIRSRTGFVAIVAAFFAVCVIAAAARPLASLVPGLTAEETVKISGGESIILDATVAQTLKLLPATQEGARIKAWAEARKSAFLVESAYLARGLTLSDRLAAFNALTAFKTMSGVTYFSFTRKKETVLYSEVFRTVAPGSSQILPDTDAKELPETARFDIHIRDVNFGSTWYEMTVDSRGSGFELSLSNTLPINLILVRAFGKDAMRTKFAFLQADEGILIYGVCAADPSPGAAKLVDMYSATAKRLDAVRQWTVGRLEGLR